MENAQPVLPPVVQPLPTVMLVRYIQQGGHFHCRLFTARAHNQTSAKCGDLVFDEREWPAVKEMLCKIARVEPTEAA